MKKTLTLLALLMIAGPQAGAKTETVFVDGYNTDNYQSAYNYGMVGQMCWGANAADVISWWQDQLVEQGYTLPAGVPTKNDVFTEYQAGLNAYKGGYPDSAIEWWIDGYYAGAKTNDPTHVGAFYNGLLKPMDANVYHDSGTLIKQFFPATCGGSRVALSQHIIESLQQGYALITDIGNTSVTIWGADYDSETGLLTDVYYSDPHYPSKVWKGGLSNTTDVVGQETFYISGTGTNACLTGLSCHIEEYLTEAAYTDKGTGAFSPIFNVEVDNGTSYTLSKELKAAEKGSALEGKVKADVTITNGSVKVEQNGSTEGAVILKQGKDDSARKLSVQRSGLELSKVEVNATSGNTLEVTAGNDVTINQMEGSGTLLKIGEGTLENGGSLLSTIEVKEGVLKGCGTFASVTLDGGKLIVGNSPGHQDFEGALTLNKGELVFCVSGFEDASDGDNVGWESGTYSTINMRGHELVVNEAGEIVIALSSDAAKSLTTGSGELELALVTGLADSTMLDLTKLAQQTSIKLSDEDGALPENLDAKSDLKSYLRDMEYSMNGGVLTLKGSYGATATVPEPATGTLSLLALAGLAARRRRK